MPKISSITCLTLRNALHKRTKFLLPLFATVDELHAVSKSPCFPLLLTEKDGRGNHTGGDRTAMTADVNILSNAAMSLHIFNRHRNISTFKNHFKIHTEIFEWKHHDVLVNVL